MSTQTKSQLEQQAAEAEKQTEMLVRVLMSASAFLAGFGVGVNLTKVFKSKKK